MHSASNKSISPSSISPQKTVFIVGAGAGNEVKMPIGSELKKLISIALDFQHRSGTIGDEVIASAIREASIGNIGPFLNACIHIRDAMPLVSSIDNFIDMHSDDKRIVLCGKLAIVRTILQAETDSYLFINQSQNNQQLEFDQFEKTWLNSFFHLLTQNCKPTDLAKRLKSVVFINFNYDRCIEHYLYYALQKSYRMDASEVAQLLREHLEIYHPYGTVGSLPWLNQPNAIHYGATPYPTQLLGLANEIKTFTEGTDTLSSDVNSIRSHMETSHRLVFLGFAFHKLNMELLIPSPGVTQRPKGRSVFATGHGLSKSSIEHIRADLIARGLLPSGLTIGFPAVPDGLLKCNGLFQEHERYLSFA